MPNITPIKKKKFIRFLEFVGCQQVRTKGDHIIFQKAGLERPVVIVDDKEISPFIIRSNLRTLNISGEEYIEILKRL